MGQNLVSNNRSPSSWRHLRPVRATRFEGYTVRQAAALLCGFFIAYLLAPFGTYAFLSSIVRTSSSWVVTRHRG